MIRVRVGAIVTVGVSAITINRGRVIRIAHCWALWYIDIPQTPQYDFTSYRMGTETSLSLERCILDVRR